MVCGTRVRRNDDARGCFFAWTKNHICIESLQMSYKQNQWEILNRLHSKPVMASNTTFSILNLKIIDQKSTPEPVHPFHLLHYLFNFSIVARFIVGLF